MSHDTLGRTVVAFMDASEESQNLITDFAEKLMNPTPEWVRESKHFLRKEPCWVSYGVVATPMLNLLEFFKTREGLGVSWEFKEQILAPALAMGGDLLATVGTPFDLPKDMDEGEIRKELGENHVFEDARSFCLYLASALGRQWDGKDGDFLTNGSANTFYVCGLNGEVFVVDAYWSTDDSGWSVLVYYLDTIRWDAGDRAFPCSS
ncbi:MAG: hypothetical protein NUW02_01530 [Candidatus Campbellbacteria bacterium]|nr:hypothetical protein [Candidatus Campbellbacteria bacterium]